MDFFSVSKVKFYYFEICVYDRVFITENPFVSEEGGAGGGARSPKFVHPK